MPDRGLGALFNDLNERYFDGRLPKYRVVLSSLPGGGRGMCVIGRPLIRLARGLSPEMLRRTLLHEMCHVGIPRSGHGKRWEKRMLKLADLGESWAAEEVQKYRTQGIDARNLWESTQDMLLELAHRSHRPRLQSARKICANTMGFYVDEFLHLFPRFDRAWTRACRDAEREEKLRKQFERTTVEKG